MSLSRFASVLCQVPLAFFTAALLLLTGCGDDMKDQPRFEPLEASDFFSDGRASRPPVEGTIARGQLREDVHLYEGKVEGQFAAEFPFEMTAERLKRGQQRFDIYCAVCHDRLGYGGGMIVKRGFTQPQSFHSDRLRSAPPGYFYNVITSGFGAMAPYASQIKPEDRWAIAGYIRVLQHSQNVPFNQLPSAAQAELMQVKEEGHARHPAA